MISLNVQNVLYIFDKSLLEGENSQKFIIIIVKNTHLDFIDIKSATFLRGNPVFYTHFSQSFMAQIITFFTGLLFVG